VEVVEEVEGAVEEATAHRQQEAAAAVAVAACCRHHQLSAAAAVVAVVHHLLTVAVVVAVAVDGRYETMEVGEGEEARCHRQRRRAVEVAECHLGIQVLCTVAAAVECHP
jgi:urease accessory protein UreF